MTKDELRLELAQARVDIGVLNRELAAARLERSRPTRELIELRAEVERMREHWRPIPMAHPWQPRDSQCGLCDDARDHPRHLVDTDELRGESRDLRGTGNASA